MRRWLSPPIVKSPGARASVSNSNVLPERGDETTNTGRSIDVGDGRGDEMRGRRRWCAGHVGDACGAVDPFLRPQRHLHDLQPDRGEQRHPVREPTSPKSRSTIASSQPQSSPYFSAPSGKSPRCAHASRHAWRNGDGAVEERARGVGIGGA